jgi:hypothetical protein
MCLASPHMPVIVMIRDYLNAPDAMKMTLKCCSVPRLWA